MNLAGIFITEVEYNTGSGWAHLKAKSGEELVDLYGVEIRLYETTTPITMPTSMPNLSFNWADFETLESTIVKNWNVYHSSGQGLTGVKSPVIRYKIGILGDTSGTKTRHINSVHHFMMLSASFPANPYTGAGSTPASVSATSATVTLKFYFPGFTSTQIDTTTYNNLKALLETLSNWKVSVTGPGVPRSVQPTSVTIPAPTTTSVTDYGLAKILVTLVATISFPQSGTYTLQATFTSNDGDNAFIIYSDTGYHSVTATITANLGSTNQFMLTTDSDVVMNINISA
jgi:hypothetical protein